MPAELDELERRIMQLEIEREALRKERDKASKERLGKLEKELADLKEERGRLAAHWQQEKDAIQQSRTLKEEQEALRAEIERAQRRRRIHQSVRAAVRARAGSRTADSRAGSQARRRPERQADAEGRSRPKKTSPTSSASGRYIPVSRLMEGEVQKLIHMEERLHKRSSVRTRRSSPSRTRSGARVPDCKIPTARSAASCFSAPPASARPSSRERWRSSCSTTSRR